MSEASDQGAGGPVPARDPRRLASVIAAHRATDEREAAARAKILEALDTLDDPFDEEADPFHLTGSAVVVGSRGTVLLVHRRLRRWMQPGGHLAPGEGPSEAALREAQEETGLEVRHPPGGPRLIHVDVHSAARGHTHLDLRYLLLAPDADPAPPAGESPEVCWFTWEQAESLSDLALIGALRVARGQPEVRQFLDFGDTTQE